MCKHINIEDFDSNDYQHLDDTIENLLRNNEYLFLINFHNSDLPQLIELIISKNFNYQIKIIEIDQLNHPHLKRLIGIDKFNNMLMDMCTTKVINKNKEVIKHIVITSDVWVVQSSSNFQDLDEYKSDEDLENCEEWELYKSIALIVPMFYDFYYKYTIYSSEMRGLGIDQIAVTDSLFETHKNQLAKFLNIKLKNKLSAWGY